MINGETVNPTLDILTIIYTSFESDFIETYISWNAGPTSLIGAGIASEC